MEWLLVDIATQLKLLLEDFDCLALCLDDHVTKQFVMNLKNTLKSLAYSLENLPIDIFTKITLIDNMNTA